MKVAVLFAEGFEEVEALTVVDVLRRAGIEVIMAGLDNEPVRSSHGVVLKIDEPVNKLPVDLDAVILPGGMPGAKNLSESAEVLGLVRQMHEDKKLIAGICAAPAFVFKRAGVLDGRKFTCYPGFESRVDNADFCEDEVVVDGNIITSRGPGTAMAFALKVLAFLQDEEAASDMAAKLLYKK